MSPIVQPNKSVRRDALGMAQLSNELAQNYGSQLNTDVTFEIGQLLDQLRQPRPQLVHSRAFSWIVLTQPCGSHVSQYSVLIIN